MTITSDRYNTELRTALIEDAIATNDIEKCITLLKQMNEIIIEDEEDLELITSMFNESEQITEGDDEVLKLYKEQVALYAEKVEMQDKIIVNQAEIIEIDEDSISDYIELIDAYEVQIEGQAELIAAKDNIIAIHSKYDKIFKMILKGK